MEQTMTPEEVINHLNHMRTRATNDEYEAIDHAIHMIESLIHSKKE